MHQPNKRDSVVTKFATIIEENKKKRQLLGDYSNNEPEPLIFDMNYEDGVYDEDGVDVSPSWEHTNLISIQCVCDILGDDSMTVRKLLMEHPVVVDVNECQLIYYRESEVIRAIDILTILAKSNFVHTLRPQYQFVKDNEPVYSSKDLMKILDVKEERLRKFRDEGYLGYTKYPNSDKIWYTKQNV